MTITKASKGETGEDVVQQFIAASREEAERQAERESLRRKGFRIVSFLAVVALLLATMALFSRQAAIRQMEQAQLNRRSADDLIDFMLVDLKNKLDSVGRLDILEDVGQKAMDYFDSLPGDQLTGDALLRQVQALHRIGEVRFKQNDKKGALETFGQALAKAESLAQRNPINSDWQYELVVSYFWIAEVHRLDHNPKAALPYCQDYLDVAGRMNQARPEDDVWTYELACANQNLAAIHDELGRWQEALEFAERNITLTEALSQKKPDDTSMQRDLASGLSWRGKILLEHGHLDQARKTFTRALKIQKTIVAVEPENQYFKQNLREFHRHLSYVYRLKGEVQLALEHEKTGHEINLGLTTLDPSNQVWKHRLILSYMGIGRLNSDLGHPGKASQYFKKAHILAQDFKGPEQMVRWERDNAQVQCAMARIFLESGLPDQALMAVGDLNLTSREATEDIFLLIESLILLGRAYYQLGHHKKATMSWERVLELSEGKDHIFHRYQRALSFLYLDRPDEAHPLIESLQRMGFAMVPFWREVHRLCDDEYTR